MEGTSLSFASEIIVGSNGVANVISAGVLIETHGGALCEQGTN